jgi:uncharacterized coiled-coil protein SlyX
VLEQEATISQLKSIVAQQQKGIEALASNQKKQASQIEKVSAQLEVKKPTRQVVANQ